jgi:hypothetical protein
VSGQLKIATRVSPSLCDVIQTSRPSDLIIEHVFRKVGGSCPRTRRSRPGLDGDPSLCAALYTACGVGELYLRRSSVVLSFRYAEHKPIRLGDELGRLVTASLVMTRSRGPGWGQTHPGERRRETAETWKMIPQPRRSVLWKGAARLSGGEEQIARASSAYAQCACFLSLKMEGGGKLDKGLGS